MPAPRIKPPDLLFDQRHYDVLITTLRPIAKRWGGNIGFTITLANLILSLKYDNPEFNAKLFREAVYKGA